MFFLCSSFVVISLVFLLSTFFFYGYGDHRDLHSFPTRRSSDLRHADRLALEIAHRLDLAVGEDDHAEDGLACLRSEEHTSELQSRVDLVCRLLLEKKKKITEKDKHYIE